MYIDGWEQYCFNYGIAHTHRYVYRNLSRAQEKYQNFFIKPILLVPI